MPLLTCALAGLVVTTNPCLADSLAKRTLTEHPRDGVAIGVVNDGTALQLAHGASPQGEGAGADATAEAAADATTFIDVRIQGPRLYGSAAAGLVPQPDRPLAVGDAMLDIYPRGGRFRLSISPRAEQRAIEGDIALSPALLPTANDPQRDTTNRLDIYLGMGWSQDPIGQEGASVDMGIVFRPRRDVRLAGDGPLPLVEMDPLNETRRQDRQHGGMAKRVVPAMGLNFSYRF